MDFIKKLVSIRSTPEEHVGDTPTSEGDFIEAMKCYGNDDYVAAAGLLLLAAEQGHARAQNNLAQMYRAGQGVDKNEEEEFKWFKKAAEQDIPNAQTNVGIAYRDGKGTTQSDKDAFYWFRKAALSQEDTSVHNGIPEAQYSLGMMYFDGRGVEKSDSEADFWIKKAAENAGAIIHH